jgi:hypothetical protein
MPMVWELCGYIGPGSGLELIAQFLALVALTATAILAVLFQPIVSFWRFVRGKFGLGARGPGVDADGSVAREQEENAESLNQKSECPRDGSFDR